MRPLPDKDAFSTQNPGPLHGLKVLEFTGLGPGPFASMLLADMGADVVRIDRPEAGPNDPFDVMARGKRSITIDLKSEEGRATALGLAAAADIVIEGFRPGTMEHLGLGPETMLAQNRRLIFGRITGWGQTGPLSRAAGHDLNYIALSGALGSIRSDGRPVPPLNLLGDFAGGSMFLLFGLLAALHERSVSGRGQVVDAAMVDGASMLLTAIRELRGKGLWEGQPGTNLLDGGAHFYTTYECADGNYVSIAPIEPQFYRLLCERLDLSSEFADQWNREDWPRLSARLAEIFRSRSRADWCALLEQGDTCFAPVLSLDEAVDHPHNRERGAFIEVEGVMVAAPAPRLSRSPASIRSGPPLPGQHGAAIIADWLPSKAD